MKILYLILTLFYIINITYSHESPIHKYLTKQAWELVRDQHHEVEGSEMDIAMKREYNYDWEGYHYGPWSSKCIVNGSFREDEEDPAFHMEIVGMDCGIFGENVGQGWFTTNNHFWDADLGLNQHWVLCPSIFCGCIAANNAREKLIAYGDGTATEWLGNYKFNIPWGPYPIWYNGELRQALLGLSYNEIHKAFSGEILVPVVYIYEQIFPEVWIYIRHNLNPPEPLSHFLSQGEIEEIRQYIVWEILGRMCHLIEDMGVPAHVHDDDHPLVDRWWYNMWSDPDYYEHWYEPYYFTSKTFQNAKEEGGVINYSRYLTPTQVACYSAYIVNQIADRFGSSDENGDTYYEPDYSEVLSPIYASIGNVTTEHGHGNEVQHVLFAHSYTYIMRAVAGFLWHFFNYASVQPGIPYDLTLSNRYLNPGIIYKAYHNITLDNVITSYLWGGNGFLAGNSITITNSSIKAPENNSPTYFKIQNFDNIAQGKAGFDSLFMNDNQVIDTSYFYREMISTIIKFRDYEKKHFVKINLDSKTGLDFNKNSDKVNSLKEQTEKQDDKIRYIDPESYFGKMIISIIQNKKDIKDVTDIVKRIDSINIKKVKELKYENVEKEHKINNNIPKEFSLSQNYPNPFNPITTINYGLKENSMVTIVIYNILGQKIKTLVNEFQNAGYKSIIWDGSNENGEIVSSGVYIYKLSAGTFISDKKMIFLK